MTNLKKWNASGAVLLLALGITSTATWAQQDPGPRSGPAAAGGSYPGLNGNEQAFFNQAISRFMEVDSVSGTIEKGKGLRAHVQR